MTPEQIDVFAEGLYQLAVCDGVDDTEVRFIREFLADAGADPARIDRLGQREFDAGELAWTLNTQNLRRLFIKACYLLVKADGKVSDAERTLIAAFAEEVGETAHLAELEQDAVPMPSA